jgi:hypothetical protein
MVPFGKLRTGLAHHDNLYYVILSLSKDASLLQFLRAVHSSILEQPE